MKFVPFLSILFLLINFSCAQKDQAPIERELDFNFDWKFSLVNDTTKPVNLPLDDASWRDVRLPHDWSVEASFDSTLEGCTGYLLGGVGIYQKHFVLPEKSSNKSIYLLFDGVYNNATFWLNGKLLGENPYGYSPVYFQLNGFLNDEGKENIVTVHVDHSRYADSRWYTGSGIYRNVKLVSLDKLHVPIWGTYITTPEIVEEQSTVKLELTVENEYEAESTFSLLTRIIDNDGNQVAEDVDELLLAPGQKDVFVQTFVVKEPQLWDCDNPNRYKAVTSILKNGKLVDEYTTPFGIRDLKFEAGKGFFLNGKPTLARGVCLHHDGGLVGAAVPKGVWKRRLKLLKEAGCNAIRTAHNPYSQEFLDLCDELGFLVQNELFDEFDYPKDKRLNYHDRHDDYITRGYTEHFQKWGKSDLTRTILRDRNHPSVFQWSLGNEIEWTYLHYRYVTGFWKDPKNPQNAGGYWGSRPILSPEELKKRYEDSPKKEYVLAETAQKLNKWVKELDPSRVTTANHVIPQVSHVSGYADAVDIAGYSYRNPDIDWAHKYFPHKQVTINECPGMWDDWKQVVEHPGVFGIFIWTGISYMGEAHNDWPAKDSGGDMLDLAGFKRQGWNYFKSLWVDEPHISLGTLPLQKSGFTVDELSGRAVSKTKQPSRWRNSNMHWNYAEGENILVEVCSNYSLVELFLNGRSLGMRSMSECPDRLFRWVVPFEAGTLTARAGFSGQQQSAQLQTTSEPVGFTLTSDKAELMADGYDVAHIVFQLVDKEGREVKTSDVKVSFSIAGEARLLGVDNGASDNVQDFQSNSIVTSQGRCLMIIQSNRKPGNVVVSANANGFNVQTVNFEIKK